MTKRNMFMVAFVMTAIFCMATTVLAQGYPAGMVAYWKFDEGSGTIANDTFGPYDGTLVNGPVWTSGLIEGGLSFSEGSSYVKVSPITLSDFTVSAWVRPNTGSHGGSIVDNELCGAVDDWGLRLTEDLRVQVQIGSGDGNERWPIWDLSESSVPTNIWSNIAVTRSTVDGKVRIYINGVLDLTVDSPHNRPVGNAAPICDTGSHGNLIGIGNTQQAVFYGSPGFDGVIDEAVIYNRALPMEEIQQNYLSGLQGQGYEVISRPQPNVGMTIEKMEVDLKNGRFEIKGTLDVVDSDFVNLVPDPQFRMLLELQTGEADIQPVFGITGENQGALISNNERKLKLK